jgi:ubiquinone biosynthesis protein UbiJ
MFDRLAAESVVAWYRRLLAREDWARAALAPYAGRSARFESGPLAVCVVVEAGGGLAVASGVASVTVTLDPQVLAGSLFAPDSARRRMRIEGDAEFAQALTDVLAKLRPDPAEDLARLLGDAPAQRIVDAAGAALREMRDAAQRLARHGAEYFVAENPMLLGRQEFAGFVADVAQLRACLDGLEKRLEAAAGSAGKA